VGDGIGSLAHFKPLQEGFGLRVDRGRFSGTNASMTCLPEFRIDAFVKAIFAA